MVNGAVEFDILVDASERIQMIGGGGTAYVASSAAWRAMDVSTWTQMWSNSNLAQEPVAALVNRRVAMHDLNTGMLHELDPTGATLALVNGTGFIGGPVV